MIYDDRRVPGRLTRLPDDVVRLLRLGRGAFTVGEARRFGITDDRLNRLAGVGLLVRPARGAYADAHTYAEATGGTPSRCGLGRSSLRAHPQSSRVDGQPRQSLDSPRSVLRRTDHRCSSHEAYEARTTLATEHPPGAGTDRAPGASPRLPGHHGCPDRTRHRPERSPR
ncbi:MAG: type IV toxin-antitoxin system AbiEi family antitoxin domain-containing protein [Jiangellaceae bacterium]